MFYDSIFEISHKKSLRDKIAFKISFAFRDNTDLFAKDVGKAMNRVRKEAEILHFEGQ